MYCKQLPGWLGHKLSLIPLHPPTAKPVSSSLFLPALAIITELISGPFDKDEENSVKFVGDEVFGNGYARGQAGTVDGHKFDRDGHCIGRLGANMNVYDADGPKIG